MRKKNNYDHMLKAKLALELIGGKKSLVELSSENKIPQTNICNWKDRLTEFAHELFLPESEKNKELRAKEAEISNLHKIIGEISVENNFLKKKLKI